MIFIGGKQIFSDSSMLGPATIRRTASLDALYMKPSCKVARDTTVFTVFQFDKATQTDESTLMIDGSDGIAAAIQISHSPSDFDGDTRREKCVRQKFQSKFQRNCEHSVSSQTLSSSHSKFFSKLILKIGSIDELTASPVCIPARPYSSQRPMRSSVEGLNQEIEKLVLLPDQSNAQDSESSHVSYAIFVCYIMLSILKVQFTETVYPWHSGRSSCPVG